MQKIKCWCGATVQTQNISNCGQCGFPLMSPWYTHVWLKKVKKEFIKKVNNNGQRS